MLTLLARLFSSGSDQALSANDGLNSEYFDFTYDVPDPVLVYFCRSANALRGRTRAMVYRSSRF